jgi:thioredoxin 1
LTIDLSEDQTRDKELKMSTLIEEKVENLDGAIAGDTLVVIKFGAPWCPPCRRMDPDYDVAATEIGEAARFFKVDVDETPEIGTRFNVLGIPNTTFIKGGKVVDVAVGAISRSEIVKRVRQSL